jgi:hypothetical protein
MGLGGKATSRKHVNRTDLERSSIQAIRVAHFLLARVLYADPRDVCHHALTSALTSQVSWIMFCENLKCCPVLSEAEEHGPKPLRPRP